MNASVSICVEDGEKVAILALGEASVLCPAQLDHQGEVFGTRWQLHYVLALRDAPNTSTVVRHVRINDDGHDYALTPGCVLNWQLP